MSNFRFAVVLAFACGCFGVQSCKHAPSSGAESVVERNKEKKPNWAHGQRDVFFEATQKLSYVAMHSFIGSLPEGIKHGEKGAREKARIHLLDVLKSDIESIPSAAAAKARDHLATVVAEYLNGNLSISDIYFEKIAYQNEQESENKEFNRVYLLLEMPKDSIGNIYRILSQHINNSQDAELRTLASVLKQRPPPQLFSH